MQGEEPEIAKQNLVLHIPIKRTLENNIRK